MGVALSVQAPVLSGKAHWAHCQPHLRDTLARAGGVMGGTWLLSSPGWGLGLRCAGAPAAPLQLCSRDPANSTGRWEPGSSTGEEPGQGRREGGQWALGSWAVSGPKVTQRKP